LVQHVRRRHRQLAARATSKRELQCSNAAILELIDVTLVLNVHVRAVEADLRPTDGQGATAGWRVLAVAAAGAAHAQIVLAGELRITRAVVRTGAPRRARDARRIVRAHTRP